METGLSRFLRTRPLAAMSMMIIVGAIAGVSVPGNVGPFMIGAAVFAVVAAALQLMRRPHCFAAWLCVAALLAAGNGAWRAERPDLATVRGVSIVGTVADSPQWQSERIRAVMHLTDVTVNGEELPYDIRLYAYGELARRITIADRVSMQTNLYEPSRSGNGGFDFRNYLWAEGVAQYASLESHLIEVIPQDGGIPERIAELRSRLHQRTEALFPENAALLKGLMLGDRTDIADEDEAAFSQSGIMHLLAVSGLHVSILASFLTAIGVLLCVPKVVMLVLVSLLLCLYAALCGGSPSVVRAVIMYLLLQGGSVARRGNDDLTRLTATCALMVLIDPLQLWKTGFQLSFAAVAGIVMLMPTMQQLYGRFPVFWRTGLRRRVADAVMPGIAVQLGGLPVVLASFGEVAWISLILNVFCIPLALVVLLLGLISLTLDFLVPAVLPALLADTLTGWLTQAAHWASDLPFGLMQIPALLMPFAIAYAVCLLAASAQFRTKLRTRLIALFMLPVLVLTSACTARVQTAMQDFAVTFLDVGQGDAAIINAGGSLYLMDVGEAETVAEYIEDHQLDIRGIFLSHAHDDHAGGLTEVLAACDPEWICLPQGYDGSDADEMSIAVIEAARAEGAEFRLLKAGDRVALSKEVDAHVLYPTPEAKLKGGNETSLLLRVTYGDSSVLFTGDLPIKAEPVDIEHCDVLKVAHHGSAASSGSVFLANVRPDVAVVSVGEGNLYGHPKQEVLQRLENFGCKVLRTDVHGAITVLLDEKGNVRTRTYYSAEETE